MKILLHWIMILGIAYASQEDQITFTSSASSSNIAEMTDENIENLARQATEHHKKEMLSNFEVNQMTAEDIENLAKQATEHHMTQMLSNFEQQNGHPLGGYPLQYMGVPQGTYVEFYMFQPPQYMHHWHLQDTSPGRHITQRYSSRQPRRTHDVRLSSESNQEETTTETRFYKSKIPREGNCTVITKITGSKVTYRVPKNDSSAPGGWSGWFPPHVGEIKNTSNKKVFVHRTNRGRSDQWEFDYVAKNIVFRNANRPTWINITEAEYQQILKDGKKNAVPWTEELNDDE